MGVFSLARLAALELEGVWFDPRITLLCHELAQIMGNPMKGGSEVFEIWNLCPMHNCMDEQCGVRMSGGAHMP